MGCSCPAGEGGRFPLAEPVRGSGEWQGTLGRGDGIPLEPFPRQVLVGISGGAFSYFSPIYDASHWRSIAWWVECYGSLPGVTGLPLTMFLETADAMDGPWTAMATQAFGVADVFADTVDSPSSLVRVRVEIIASEISSMACRLVARSS
jgi:hypothetical protein